VGKASLVKGHAFERQICHLFEDELGISCKRELDQVRESELGDIVISPFVVECKRRAARSETCRPPTAWWDQVWTAGENLKLTPILIWKYDYRDITAMVPLNLLNPDYLPVKSYTAILDVPTLMMVMREEFAD
tara:strand:- start:261 stop:659 length:399 start_codon:yes stop_codon:yes gene_type:complete